MKYRIRYLGDGLGFVLTNEEAKSLVRGIRHLVTWCEKGSDDADMVNKFGLELMEELLNAGIDLSF